MTGNPRCQNPAFLKEIPLQDVAKPDFRCDKGNTITVVKHHDILRWPFSTCKGPDSNYPKTLATPTNVLATSQNTLSLHKLLCYHSYDCVSESFSLSVCHFKPSLKMTLAASPSQSVPKSALVWIQWCVAVTNTCSAYPVASHTMSLNCESYSGVGRRLEIMQMLWNSCLALFQYVITSMTGVLSP